MIIGTLKITVIATIFAVPVGLGAAIYLSEYASDRARRIIKPILEILAGIPTIVFGFFALTFVTPVLRSFIPGLGEFNAISPGLVVGIMIVPLITSLSEDAMASVPNKIREGAYGLGATKLEVATKVVLPAATSGIVASIVLAISRAIGETMIVSLAAGSSPTASLSLTSSIQTMTGYIVEIATGDATFGSNIYYSIYAVGFTLFIFTLIMNLLSQWISKRFRRSINMEMTDNNRQSLVDQQLVQKHLSSRTVKNKVFKLIFLACTLLGLVVLIALLTQTLIKG